ncbi:MAG TPA: hypothetical protein VIL86_18935, partial [Tepidisphaeraceae bacterium]
WYYCHPRYGLRGSSVLGFWHADAASLWGFHRAYTDGSVTWDDGTSLDLRLGNRDATAAAKLISNDYYWWF